ncbi:RES family NAD+ phosphorylase [Pseudofulvibacter geojedonensis]|uniref:RES family NAD+ phosphorylase n=1 Tax=Pseudofulvibacter geojedonensis TaxID=1123758 RepID=A0ABW3HZF7_9FLAO
MQVYRIAKEAYIRDLTGIGAKAVGGRWNFKGISVCYTSSTISLSMLECLAHFPPAFTPKDMAFATIEIPGNSIQEIVVKDLPDNWKKVPSPRVLKDIGYQWIKEQEKLLLKVPSIIVPQEYNYIINPFHPDFKKVKLSKVTPFPFDNRVL